MSEKNNRPEEYNGFYRSSDEKMILGFCGGLAHKFNMDPMLVRVLAFLFMGWIYLIGLAFPELPTKDVK